MRLIFWLLSSVRSFHNILSSVRVQKDGLCLLLMSCIPKVTPHKRHWGVSCSSSRLWLAAVSWCTVWGLLQLLSESKFFHRLKTVKSWIVSSESFGNINNAHAGPDLIQKMTVDIFYLWLWYPVMANFLKLSVIQLDPAHVCRGFTPRV